MYENSVARSRSREVGFSYDLFPELSQPVIDQNVLQIVPEAELLPQPLVKLLPKNPKKQKNRKLIAVPKNRRCSFLDPEMKTRLEAAIKAYHQIKEYGATFLLVNGSMTEKITDISVVCDLTKISHKTLLNHVTPGRIKKSSFGCGPRAILGSAVEQEIVNYIVWMDDEGWPLSWRRIRIIARDIAVKSGIKNFSASNRWKNGFKKRHPELSTRLAENLERTRVGGMNKEQTHKYFDLLEKVKSHCATLNGDNELSPSLVYNLDEAGVDQVSEMDGDRHVVVLKIKRTPTYRKTSADRTHLSAAVCVGGDGWRAKTMYALKGKVRKEETLPMCPPGTDYIMTAKGYFDDSGFFEYIKFLVMQLPKDGKWRVLVFDGYGAHTMVKSTLDYLVAHRIHAVCMPSHTSQFLQPLDVSCFGPVKHEFRLGLADIQFKLGTEAVGKWELPCVFEMAMEQGCTPSNIVSGFRKCGITGISSQEWMEKNKDIFHISAALNDSRVQSHLTAKKAAEIGENALVQIDSTLEIDGLRSPLKAALSELKNMIEPCVALARKIAPSLCSPPKEGKKRRRIGPAVNSIDELQSAAKWVTDEQRRLRIDEKVRGLTIRHENNEREQAKKDSQKEAKLQEKEEQERDYEAVRKLLIQHKALQPDSSLDKKAVVDFYVSNKEDIDEIIGISIPASKRTKANLVKVILDHYDRILDM